MVNNRMSIVMEGKRRCQISITLIYFIIDASNAWVQWCSAIIQNRASKLSILM